MKKTKQNLLFIFSFLALSLTSMAESANLTNSDSTSLTNRVSAESSIEQKTAMESKKPFYYMHNLGVATGFTTGWGLSYRYFPGKFGCQTNIIGYKDVNTGDLSVGATLLYSLYTTNFSNLFLYQANSYYYKYPNDPNGFGITPNTFNHGLGFGLELITNEHYAFNLMLGYGAFQNFVKISPTIEVALYYKFK